ncbi:MAG: nucleotidyltransferase domain-containing protein [Pseudomonadota bacterium]
MSVVLPASRPGPIRAASSTAGARAPGRRIEPSAFRVVPFCGTFVPEIGSTMALSISDALFGKTQQAVLGMLFGQPERSFYLRELAAAAGGGISQVQRELARLTEAGLVVREPRGRQVWFRANPESPVFFELKSLISKTAGIADVLRAALEPFARRIQAAFVYGSVARGEHDAASDVDVLVIGKLRPAALAPTKLALGARLGRPVQFVVLSPAEWKKRLAESDHFTLNVFRQPKIWLIGSQAALAVSSEQGTRQSRRRATAKG